MARFFYRAKEINGTVVSGVAEAADKEELIRNLRRQGLFCFAIKNKTQTTPSETPVQLKQIALFCRQLAAMLHAGVTMTNALDIIYQSAKSKRMKAAVLQLYEGVQKGQALSVTMSQMNKTFPELLIYMIETGEASGTLDTIMEQMADHFEKEVEMNAKIRAALLYPAILSIVSVAVVIFLITVILPQFITMYAGIELPLPTRMLLSLSHFVRTKWPFLLGGLLGLVFLWMYFMTKRNFRIRIHHWKFKIPIVGKLYQTIITSRFASTFCILYQSGVNVLKGMEIIARVLRNSYVEKKLFYAAEGLRRGEMLSECLEKTEMFEAMFLSMILVGEESGSLDDILQKTGSYYQREAQQAATKLVGLIGPIMIVILGVIIGFIVISIMLPIFTMYNQIL